MTVKGAKALEMWCARATDGYPAVDVCNMSSAWRNGLAFCAIIHRFRPDLIDFAKLDKRDVRGNCALAFALAEKHFGIPQLLDPEDMAGSDCPDRLSILTYVSEYYHKMKSLQPRGSPRDLSSKAYARQDSLDSAGGTSLSRTPSSSGVSSSQSCTSSSSSVCDSPPPSASPPASASASPKLSTSEQQESSAPSASPATAVVMRRKQTTLANRRLVQSMILESTSSMSSLMASPCLSASPPSPEIERENPFRDAMLKFAAMEKKACEETSQPRRKSSPLSPAAPATLAAANETSSPTPASRKSSLATCKSTETLIPKQDSKSTQTPGVVKSLRSAKTPSSPNVASMPSPLRLPSGIADAAAPRPLFDSPTPASLRGSTTTLSYTATPRPYTGQMLRSGSLGHSLNVQPQPMTSMAHAYSTRQLSTPNESYAQYVQRRQQQQQRVAPRPMSMLGAGLSVKRLDDPTTVAMAPQQQPQMAFNSYSSSPSLMSYSYAAPSAYTGFPAAYRSAFERRDRMQLHMEGQASLV